MGRFTGKSDFEDLVLMHYGPREVLNGTVAINGAVLKLETERDLIPLYPYLCSMMSGTKQEDGSTKINVELCSTSYIDTMEERWKASLVSEIAYYCKHNKKKPTEITLEDVKSIYDTNHIFSDETLQKVVNIISKGKSAFAFGIVVSVLKGKERHEFIDCIIKSFSKEYLYSIKTEQATRQRKELLKYASENGWSKKYDCSNLTKENAKNYYTEFANEKDSNMNVILNRILYKVIDSV